MPTRLIRSLAPATLIALVIAHSSYSAERLEQSGKQIAAAISADLSDSPRIADADLQLSVRNGIATLSGTVNSIMDRQRAVSIAKRTRGVTAISDQIIVNPSDRSDDAILEDVKKRLRINDSVDKPHIALDLTNGILSMTGAVDSLAEKRIAEVAAGGTRGVVDINNQLTVRPVTDRTDQEIRDEVAGLLVHSVYLDDVTIRVAVDKSVVKLSGVVSTVEQRDYAERLAEIRGVKEVDVSAVKIDADEVDPTERRKRYASVSDEQVKTALQRLFANDPVVFQSMDAIDVGVKNGVVSLNGVVNNLVTKRKAERLASDVIGVHRVINELEVEWDDKVSDLDIIRDVQDAIRRSPYLDRREVRVHSQRAHVSLFGIVESELEKKVAGWLADNVAGVVHVNNNLAIEKKWKPKADQQIKKDLERKLKFTLFDESSEIDVTVENGVAILRGEVDTWRQWQAAMDLALEAGAKHPHNLINVRYHPPHGGSRIYIGY